MWWLWLSIGTTIVGIGALVIEYRTNKRLRRVIRAMRDVT